MKPSIVLIRDSGNSKDIDCLLGKAGVLERLEEKEKAADVYRKVLSIDRENETAKEKLPFNP